MPDNQCGSCSKVVSRRVTQIRCDDCKNCFHVKCAKINTAQYIDLLIRGVGWLCNNCHQSAFPLASIENNEILNFFNSRTCNSTPLAKKTKCDSCPRKIPKRDEYALCTTCNKFNHLKCAGLTSHNFPLPIDYQCPKCCTQSLPFSKVTNDDLLLTIEGFDKQSADFLRNVPSFSIQSLIDHLPGQKFDTDEFISDNTESKYTPQLNSWLRNCQRSLSQCFI